jgi:hypothetical protein
MAPSEGCLMPLVLGWVFLLVFKFGVKFKAANVSSRMAGTTLVMGLHVLAMPFLVSLTKPSLILFDV